MGIKQDGTSIAGVFLICPLHAKDFICFISPEAACGVALKLGRVKLLGQVSKQHRVDENPNLIPVFVLLTSVL